LNQIKDFDEQFGESVLSQNDSENAIVEFTVKKNLARGISRFIKIVEKTEENKE
jgi:hypothetical protein